MTLANGLVVWGILVEVSIYVYLEEEEGEEEEMFVESRACLMLWATVLH